MDKCTSDCGSCSSNCKDRKSDSLIKKSNQLSNVKKVIGIVSGKGGVGKSMVTSLLAVLTRRKGFNTAILDADITGPSIPKIFGLKDKAKGNKSGIFPVKSSSGINIMSLNLLLEDETAPVIWRGSIISNTVTQFWTDVIWGDVDYMFIDMPPGTGDVPLTVFQSIPLNGVIIVTSPQDLVSMIVSKAVTMAKMMKVPILGMVENFSYLKCSCCDTVIKPFGDSQVDEVAKQHSIEVLAKLPIDTGNAKLCDLGLIENFDDTFLDKAVSLLIT